MAWLHRGLRGDVAASHMSPGGVSMISSARHRASYLGERQKPPLGRASSTSSSTCADCPLCHGVVTSHGGKASRSCSSTWFGEKSPRALHPRSRESWKPNLGYPSIFRKGPCPTRRPTSKVMFRELFCERIVLFLLFTNSARVHPRECLQCF